MPKTHDLDKLLDLVAEIDAALADVLEEADQLTPFGVAVRYPGLLPRVAPETARRALQVAGEVLACIVPLLERELGPGPSGG